MSQNKKFSTEITGNGEAIQTRKLKFDAKTNTLVEHQQTAPFLRGPIPLSWLKRAAEIPGKSINVALAVYWLTGMSQSKVVKLNRRALQNFHVSNDAATDALNRLEACGLVKLTKNAGQRTQIEVLPYRQDNPAS